jgi:hypothetical protein
LQIYEITLIGKTAEAAIVILLHYKKIMLNKIYFLGLVFTLCSLWVNGQSIGIGTTSPNTSAILDISSTNKGLLLPRMNTVQRTGILTPASGLTVYDTDTNSTWIFNGTWVELSNAAIAWTLNGNAPSSNTKFIGTTNNQPMNFKMNNETIMKIGTDKAINIFQTIGGLFIGDSVKVDGINTMLGYKAGKFINSGQ